MDKSETFIKMSDCEEIQAGHIPGIGDFYWEEHIDGEKTVGVVYDTGNNDYRRLDWGAVWLPDQSQLQEMVIGLCTDTDEPWPDRTWNLLTKFMDFTGGLVNWGNTSMEQLWLSFVMFELHKKKWNGSSWCSDVTFSE